MNKKSVLSIKNLNKTYSINSSKSSNSVHALKNLNLDVKEGEIFGLLGPNGAGKTTFMNVLAGTTIKTSGEVNVWGFDLDANPRQVRASIGIVPQEVNLDPFFSPRKLLELQAGMYGVKKKDRITNTVLKLVSLEKEGDRYARSLSGGMKRRLLMAKALVHQPPILFLDEPTAGVDINLRKNLWDNVKLLNKLGVTIILTTHYLEEAEQMCDRIGILTKGSLVALDSTQNLLNRIQTKKVIFKVDSPIDLKNDSLKSLKIIYNDRTEICVSYEKNALSMNELIEIFNKANVKILDISSDDGDLEDVFVNITKN
jgi:ABC-2 type transport system ATP-binding protein